MKWVGYETREKKMRNVYKIFGDEPEEMRPVGERKHNLRDNIKMLKK
jgi:hypothetical protein